MQKKFITNLALVILVNLLIKPFWILGIDRNVQIAVGEQSYGLYYSLLNFSFIFSILLDLGITNFNGRLIAQNNHLLAKYFFNLISIKFFLVFLYFILVLSWALLSGYESFQIKWLVMLAINQTINSFILYFRSNISGLHLFRTDSIISILDKVLMIAFCLPLLLISSLKEHFRIEWFIYAQTASFMITALISGGVVLARSEKLIWRFNKKVFFVLIRQSYPYALMVLLMGIYNKVDTIMMERMLPDGDFQTGVYANSYRLLDAISMIAFLISGLLLPMFSRMIKQKQSVSELVQLSFSILIIPAFMISLICFFFRTEIITIFYHTNQEYSSAIFGILMFSFIGVAFGYIFGTLLTAKGSIRLLNIISLIGVLINVLLNLWFIPHYGALGAAITSVITFIAVALIQVIYCEKYFQIGYFKKSGIRLIVFCFLFACMVWIVKSYPLPGIPAMVGLMCIGLIFAVVLRLIPLREIIFYFRKEALQGKE